MKPKITPINQEIEILPNQMIVSKTDLAGRITYVNRTFMKVADYTEPQLLGVQHNIIRHPDMPRGVFRFLWSTLKEGREFFGYVKNMTSSGAYYWVFANVTPDRDAEGKVQGYYSVRRSAPDSAIKAIIPLYNEMVRIERATPVAEAPDASLRWLLQHLAKSGQNYEELMLGLYQNP